MTSYPLHGFIRTNVYQAGAYWQWSVFGPAGGAIGIASSEEDAKHKAQQAGQAVMNPYVKGPVLGRPPTESVK